MGRYNDFLEMAKERYSVRRFAEKQITKEDLDRILEAGRVSPTAANKQPQRIYVLQSEEALSKAKTVTKYTFNAPTILLICADTEDAWTIGLDGHNCGIDDAMIVTTQMMYAAFDIGIGSCWVRGFNEKEVKEVFGLPDNIVPMAFLPIGYICDESKAAKGWHDSRKPIGETVTYL